MNKGRALPEFLERVVKPVGPENEKRLSGLRFWRRRLGRRGAFALEFALVAPLFLLLLFVVFEISYDLFMQEVLDNTMQLTARAVQIGNTQSATSGTFVHSYACPNSTGGLLNCNNLYIRVERLAFPGGSCTATQDVYDGTTGTIPLSGGVLELGDFYNGAGNAGLSGTLNLSPCATASPNTGFCNAGPQELILLTAVYVAPSFLDGLVLNRVQYNGKYVRAQMDTVAFETEAFTSSSPATPC